MKEITESVVMEIVIRSIMRGSSMSEMSESVSGVASEN